MRRIVSAAAASTILVGVVALAQVGNGNVTASPPVSIVLTGGGSGSTTMQLHNTSTGGYTVLLSRDAACDQSADFSVSGANPFVLGALGSKTVSLACDASTAGFERCLVHATDANTGEALVDLMIACEHAATASLVPAASSLDFGTLVVGDSANRSVAFTNTSATTIAKLFAQTTDLDGDFEITLPCNPDAPYCDDAIAPIGNGESATVSVKCSPRSPGTHTAELELATDTSQHSSQRVMLTCVGSPATVPVLGVSPVTVRIADPVEVVSGTGTTAVHLENLGTGIVQITDIRMVDIDVGAAADWSFGLSGTCSGTPCTLPAGQLVNLDLTFDPSAIGRRRASLLLSFHDTIDRTRSIPLDAIGQGATLSLVGQTVPLDFGTVPVGRTSSLDLHYANRGNRSTTAAVSAMPLGPFTLAPATMLTVDPPMLATLSATCTATSGGPSTTTITAQPSDTLSVAPITIPATCNGSTTPLYASPTAFALGEIRIGAGDVVHSVQLLSTGSILTFTGTPHLEMPNDAVTVGTPSAGTTPATLDITVSPQNDGDLKAKVLVDDTSGETLAIPLTGRIVTASYAVPDLVDLGTFCVGQPTASSNVSLTVDGTATIALAKPTLPNTSGFELLYTSPDVYPATVASTNKATVSVTPLRQTTARTLDANLTWSTDVENALAATTELRATFIDSGGAISPPILAFGQVPVHLFIDDGQRVMIQNCNSTQLELDPPTIKAPFSIDSPNFPTTLEPNETAIFSVGFHPTRVGTFADTLQISSPQLGGTPLQVALIGETLPTTPPQMDGGVDHTGGETSFYACACAGGRDPSGGLVIALALGLVIFRRRCGSS